MRLLVTRPEPDCRRTADLLRSRGHEVLAVPLFRIEAIPDVDLGAGPWAAVLFTSANAVRTIAVHRRFGEIVGLPAYVVGRRTKSAAAAAGFATVLSADGNLGALVRLLAERLPASRLPLLYCGGQERAGELADALCEYGKIVDTVVVYRSVPDPDVVDRIGTALKAGRIDAVLHYSARTAAAFMAAAGAAGVHEFSISIKHFCLSDQVAAALRQGGATVVRTAARPDEEALLQLVESC